MDTQPDNSQGRPLSKDADRIYRCTDGQWYIRTRGNAPLGPFATRPDAQRRLSRQLQTWDPNPQAPDWNRLNPAKFLRRSVFRQT